MKVLSEDQLKRMEEHKYKSISLSLLEPYLQVFWSWLIEFIPLWVAQNLITLIGLTVNILTSLLIIYYSPTASEIGPSWIYFVAAIGLFIYQTLDILDGKQARRTGTENALHELFDHGFDSISTVFLSLAFSASLLLGRSPDIMFAVCMNSFVLFYCGHWTAYVRGIVHFGMIDVTEVQCASILCFLVTGLFGQTIWDLKIPFLMMPLRAFPLFMIFGGCFVTLFRFTRLIVFKGGCGPNGTTVAGTSVLSPFFNMLIVFIFALTIAKKSAIMVFENHPVLYLFFFGIVFGKLTNRLLVAHMARSELYLLDTSLIGPLLLFFNQYFNSYINEYLLLWICMILALVDLILYLTCTFKQIAKHLGIFIFSLSKPEQQVDGSENASKLK